MQWNIGDVKVTLVREMMLPIPFDSLIPDYEPDVIEANRSWMSPNFVDAEGRMLLSFHALVLESQGKVIVVDTCVGDRPIKDHEAISNIGDRFIRDLEAAGYPPSSVDVVLCTHLHFDHVGWNTRWENGRWTPTFPNARYLFSRLDYEYWDAGNEGYALTFADAVRPVLEAGLADLVDMDHRVDDNVRLEPSPGHSPGHVSVCIESRGESAVITGDLVHHPIQFVRPDWIDSADYDRAMAEQTRIDFRDRYGDSPTRVFGTHFGGSSCGHLRRNRDGAWEFIA
jgi:glyoxylase-like metal-dependent hydrolase (beta-lactamase superfamily II)